MNVLIWSAGLFLTGFLLHLVWWRIQIPHHQVRALLFWFFGLLVLMLAAHGISGTGDVSTMPLPFRGPADFLHALVMYVPVVLAYIVTYTAVQVDSPSFTMILLIAESGPNGIDEHHFYSTLNDDLLVRPRIRDLVRDQMAVLDKDLYRITPKGNRFIQAILLYRRLTRLPLPAG